MPTAHGGRLLDERNKARDTAAAAAAQEAEMATPAADQAGRSRAGPPSPTKTKEVRSVHYTLWEQLLHYC